MIKFFRHLRQPQNPCPDSKGRDFTTPQLITHVREASPLGVGGQCRQSEAP
jgi:hypothetical protein